MPRVLDPLDIYDRGLADLDSLSGAERLVFMLQDFDNMMEMEGWDHFFLHERHFVWYEEMKDWLHRIGDDASLAVLGDYEHHVRSKGFEFSPAGVEGLFQAEDDGGYRDWARPVFRPASRAMVTCFSVPGDQGAGAADGLTSCLAGEY